MQHPDELKKQIEILRAENRRLREQQRGAPRHPAMSRDEVDVVLNGAGAGILVLDASMRILSCNRKLSELFQVEEPAVLGRTCREVICRGDDRSPLCIFEEVMASGRGESRTDWVFGERCFEVVATPVHAAGGDIERVILVYTEVTDRKRLESSLLEAQGRLSTIFEALPAGILVVDEISGEIAAANPAMTELIGRDVEAFAGRTRSELCPEVGDDKSEGLLRHEDGRLIPVLLTRQPVQFDGRPHRLEMFTDISERKRAEQALQRSLLEAEDARQKVDAILRSVADGLLVTDLNGRVMLMNPAAEAMLALPFQRIAGRSLGEAIDDPPLRDFLENALRRQEPFEFTVPPTDEGGSRILRGHVSFFHSRQGQATGRILILHEVTREREIEKMKREFVSTAGHELQTPLTAIVGFSELLLRQGDLPEETRRECLTFIMEKGEALSALVDRLLDINRIDAGRPLALNPEPISVRQLIDGAIACFVPDEQRRCTVKLPAAEVGLRGDREKMTRTLENLISNALKFSPPEHSVEISCELCPTGVRVTVRDRGVGMTPEQTERIFEAFYRGDSSDTSSGGAGLGMCLVKHVVEAHGGTIEIESAPGDGTRVTLMLPGEGSHAA